jgi:uncharacterized membrane protein
MTTVSRVATVLANHGAGPTISRVRSIDMVRGTATVLMALDHVRVFSGIPAGGPTLGVFFTRWITHFCAPAFVFLAGTSAFLYGRKNPDLPRFLVSRGLWLVLLELTFLRLAWTFNTDFAGYEMAGVIWCIGWCMVILGGLVKLPVRIIGAIGVAVTAAHNLLDSRMAAIVDSLGNDIFGALWRIFYVGFSAGPIRIGSEGPSLIVLYSIVPWIGVMAAGYAFGAIIGLDARRRDRWCVALGVGAQRRRCSSSFPPKAPCASQSQFSVASSRFQPSRRARSVDSGPVEPTSWGVGDSRRPVWARTALPVSTCQVPTPCVCPSTR